MVATEKVTLTMPRDLMQEVRELAPPRGQSKYIASAVRYFIEKQKSQALREELITGYKAIAEEASVMAEEWMPLGQEAWDRYGPTYEGEEPKHDAES